MKMIYRVCNIVANNTNSVSVEKLRPSIYIGGGLVATKVNYFTNLNGLVTENIEKGFIKVSSNKSFKDYLRQPKVDKETGLLYVQIAKKKAYIYQQEDSSVLWAEVATLKEVK